MWNFSLILIFIFVKGNCAVSWTDVRDDLTLLVQGYRHDTTSNTAFTNIIPRLDQTRPIAVNMSLDIFSIAEFDAVAGKLDIYGSVRLSWQDNIKNLAGLTFSRHVESIMLDYSKIWTPTIVLLNSANSVTAVGDTTYKVRFFTSNGTVTWSPRVIMSASCTPDVSFFPFDQQDCDFIFTPSTDDSTRIVFRLTENEWGKSNFDPSGVWEIAETRSSLSAIGKYSAAVFSIVIKRLPLYFAFNIVLPILLLSFLSGFLFILPFDSGERVGFGITCFLSFAILLQTIMQFLPQASSPMSLLCYYVIVMVVFSGLLSIINILILRVYIKPDGEKVPAYLAHFIELITCIKFKKCYRWCRRRNKVEATGSRTSFKNDQDNEIDGVDVMDIGEQDEKQELPNFGNKPKDGSSIKANMSEPGSSSYDDIETVDWHSVGKLLDFFFLLAFLGVQGVFSMFFLVPLGLRFVN